MSQFPSDLRYTKDHEWARQDGDLIRVGVTAYAVEQLGDITLVDLPPVGTEVQSEEQFGEIESVKTMSELVAPVSGEVVEVNEELEGSPELVNESPYDAGWLVVIRSSDGEFGRLLNATQYEDFLAKIE
ncbi:MAG: glycine cleavage system H protein [Polyangiales bacterium]|jgi:glycine cleavage system H protein